MHHSGIVSAVWLMKYSQAETIFQQVYPCLSAMFQKECMDVSSIWQICCLGPPKQCDNSATLYDNCTYGFCLNNFFRKRVLPGSIIAKKEKPKKGIKKVQ